MAITRRSIATILSTITSLTRPSVTLGLTNNNVVNSKITSIGRRSIANRLFTSDRILRGGASDDNSPNINDGQQHRSVSSETKFVKLADPAPGSREY